METHVKEKEILYLYDEQKIVFVNWIAMECDMALRIDLVIYITYSVESTYCTSHSAHKPPFI